MRKGVIGVINALLLAAPAGMAWAGPFDNAVGDWQGQAEYVAKVNAVADPAAHAVVELTVRVEAGGKISGASAENGCRLLGVITPFSSPQVYRSQVTLRQRRNVHVGRRPKGGYECELDVIGFHPTKQHLVHVEPSMDADSWAKRRDRYSKKFAAGRTHIPDLFSGFQPLPEIDQIALFGLGGRGPNETLGGGRVVLVSEWMSEILADLEKKTVASHAVPEQFICLRTVQFVLHAGGWAKKHGRK